MTEYYIKMKDLAVGYQGNALISDINLKIKKGEIVTLIGPNGAGKSTILKSITRQLKLIGGEVYIDSEEIRKLSYKEMAVKAAVMLTERMKPELMTCHDIVATGRYPYTGRLGILSREDERKVDEALEAVHAQELGIRNFQKTSHRSMQENGKMWIFRLPADLPDKAFHLLYNRDGRFCLMLPSGSASQPHRQNPKHLPPCTVAGHNGFSPARPTPVVPDTHRSGGMPGCWLLYGVPYPYIFHL